jgi:hypothetical protein
LPQAWQKAPSEYFPQLSQRRMAPSLIIYQRYGTILHFRHCSRSRPHQVLMTMRNTPDTLRGPNGRYGRREFPLLVVMP